MSPIRSPAGNWSSRYLLAGLGRGAGSARHRPGARRRSRVALVPPRGCGASAGAADAGLRGSLDDG